MSLFGRFRRHPPSTSSAWSEAQEPLDAGRWTILRANAAHLAQQNPYRQLAAHHGFRGIYRPSTLGTSFTDPSLLAHIPRDYGRKTGGCFVDFGVQWFHRIPLPDSASSTTAPYGTVYLRARWKVDGSHTLGCVLAISPGLSGPEAAMTIASAQDTTTSGTWADLDLVLPITTSLVRSESVSPAAGEDGLLGENQRGQLALGHLWFGAYNSGNNSGAGHLGQIVNLTVRYVPA